MPKNRTNFHKILTHMATGLVVAMAFGFLLVFFPQLSFIEREPLLNILLLMILGINAGLISALISNPEIDIEHTKAAPRKRLRKQVRVREKKASLFNYQAK